MVFVILIVLVAINTLLIGLMYFRWGRQLESIGDAQNIAKAYYSMARTQTERVATLAREGAKEGVKEATNGGSGILSGDQIRVHE